jgi:NAD(P)-dependent dehydrogenase (short-subunit alcohol dehydrogenase family)
MSDHPALAAGRVAVITGAASGIGLAAAQRLAALGMKICMADIDAAALDAAAASVPGATITVPTDVRHRDAVETLRERALGLGPVAVLMNNAGRESGANSVLAPGEGVWQGILDVNLWGPIHGVQVFAPAMIAQGIPGAIINTGSKQGITTPPGNAAYNVSKAGLKVLTEALAHELRNIPGCQVSAHLLIPGFTFTGFTRARTATKPDAAWTPEQVIDFMLPALAAGDFYILCPDNDVTRAIDEKRIAWAAGDIIHNRPALSRWHPDYSESFSAFLRE